jgi:polysaccharide biosynthesis transport protein
MRGFLRRRAPWILLCVLLVAGAAYGFSKHQTEKYTATASLLFNNNHSSRQVPGLPIVARNHLQARQSANVKLVQLGDMAAKTASQLGHGLTKETVREDLRVSAQGGSQIVHVSAISTSPALAADIANTYTTRFVSENSYHTYYSSALASVKKKLAALSAAQRARPAGLALLVRAQSLAVLAQLPSGSVQIAQAATVPASPSSPKVLRNTLLGALLGLLLGLGVAFLIGRFDRRIRGPSELETIYRLPLLGVVPQSTALARSDRREAKRGEARREALPPSEAEAFALIRARLRYFNVDRELRTLLVVSPAPGDGKTTVALHLAAAAARMGSTVLLVEADLRRPTVARQLDIHSGPGISDVLIGSVSLWRATQPVDLDQSSGVSGQGPTLDVLVGGAPLPPNPGELIESHAMETMLEQAESTYDLVVIDTPPLTTVSDAAPLLSQVDGVIIVDWIGRTRHKVAERLHQTLTAGGAPMLGVIANGFRATRGSHAFDFDYHYYSGNGHGSGNGSTPEEQPTPRPAAAASNGVSSYGEWVPSTRVPVGPRLAAAPSIPSGDSSSRAALAAADARTAMTARAGVLVGALAPIVVLASPWSAVSLVAMLVFVVAGLGPGITCRFDAGDPYAQAALTVTLSVAAFALAATILIWLATWHPITLLLLAIPSVLSCLQRLTRQIASPVPQLSA